MSFTKYVEVVENSAIMNMLPTKVTVLSTDNHMYTVSIGDV